MSKNVYITTPIYYANGSPHIGHFLTTTIADVFARYKRLELGEDNTFFSTGLDEHGTTVEQSAIGHGYKFENLQDFVDKKADEWEKTFNYSQISYNYFARTTNPNHISHVCDFIKIIKKNGDIYKSTYQGKYCNGCEKFLTLSDQDEKGLCPLHRPDQVVETTEDNYFFKLSKYAMKLKRLIEKNEIDIKPESKRKEILARISGKIEDVSISRPKEKVAWGIEFPGDPNQTIYVWIEALMNYTSNLEINTKEEFWKNTYHVLGKDISWFHNFIWPALLLSADKPLFKGSFVHSFLNIGGEKISKSKGNVITPDELIGRYGIDGARYLMLSNLPYKNDSDLTWKYLDQKYNADLANGLGNLVSRITSLHEGVEIKYDYFNKKQLDKKIHKYLDTYEFHKALNEIWREISKADLYINKNKVWELGGSEKIKALSRLTKHLDKIATNLRPFLPTTSRHISKLIEGKISKPKRQLFPRLHEDIKTKQLLDL